MEATDNDFLKNVAEWQAAELRPELVPYVEPDGPLGPQLKHPLVFDIPLTLPGRANEAYDYKVEALAKAIEREDWHDVVFLHERPYRCDALIDYVVGRDENGVALSLSSLPQEVRDLAATVWVDSENIHQHLEDWAAMFDGSGFILGSEEEKEEFERLSDPVRIFRADIDDGGWSWTTEESVARFFAGRFSNKDDIVVADVAKEHVFGYLSRRNEHEVLVREDAPVLIRRVIPYEEWSAKQGGKERT